MQGRIIVKAELLDGTTWEDAMPVEYPLEQAQTVVYQALGAINKVGGLIKAEDAGRCSFVPMCNVKQVTIELSAVVGANLQELGQMGQRPRGGLV